MKQQDFQLICTAALKTAQLIINDEIAKAKASGDFQTKSKETICKEILAKVKSQVSEILREVYGLEV
jgi:hypothetical protein